MEKTTKMMLEEKFEELRKILQTLDITSEAALEIQKEMADIEMKLETL